MRKTIIALSFICSLFSTRVYAEKYDFSVDKSEVSNGYVVRKIWLNNYAIPQVQIGGVSYATVNTLPVEAVPSSADRFDIILGKELKRPFALVRVPAYAAEGTGVKVISSFTIDVTEQKTQPQQPALKTTAAASPLANGSWYKIAVTSTGLYKVDYDFIVSKMGVSASAVTPANIRVFGGGGNMLPENNAIARPDGLTETAVMVNDGGDGSFGPGDYILFYAKGPMAWAKDAVGTGFKHIKNLYEDKGYYFLNFDGGQAGRRIGSQSNAPASNVNVTSYNDYQVHDEDYANPGKFGKTWLGEDFGISPGKVNTRSFDFELGTLTDDAIFKIRITSRCTSPNNVYTLSRNGQVVGTYTLDYAATDDRVPAISFEEAVWKIAGASGKNTIKIDYQPSNTEGIGYLDYIEINTRRALSFEGSSMFTFRDLGSVGTGNIANYSIANSSGNTEVWDVTDPYNVVKMSGSLSGSNYNFSQDASTLHEFAAVKDGQGAVPEYIGTVPNQNLHGEGPVDYLIITHPDFVPAANKIADFHRQRGHLTALVATTTQIYNEFSSGGQDISGLRDFIKMFYDNAGTDQSKMPKYVLLLGDASYDYKSRVASNTNYVPTFESAESVYPDGSYCDDDFYGFLDDNENIEDLRIANTLDVGVGRLPVKTLDEANHVADKIAQYKAPESLGPWRLSTTIVADNEDEAGNHMDDGEIMDSTINYQSKLYNSTKVYEDAIQFVSTPGGQRAPEANKMINDQMYKGTLLLNYSGHGNSDVLSHERIITSDDYNKWTNIHKMPIMVTATCDFAQFDQPQIVSAGEQIVLKKDGGAICAVTTVKKVYQSPNRILNKDYLDAQFQRVNGRWNTFGDAFRIGKNKTYIQGSTFPGDIVNFRKFALLGDPALEPNFPEYYIYTEEIRDGVTGAKTDTLSALGSYVINGKVGDINGNVLDYFTGRLNIIIYDKPRTVNTISGINKTFSVRNNTIYRGKATVTNGKFSVSFIAPKDINYDMGKGKLSYYAENGDVDAAGADFSHSIGGYSDHPVLENNAPRVRPYIGDSTFRNGGLTGPNSLLYAILEDETGINVSGNAVGHDLVGILDGNSEDAYILNDYYETETNTYKRGYVNFPMTNLPEGRHRLIIKAWDVNNNSGTGAVDFEVANGNVMKVQNLMNYPNPFRDKTHFVFEHNHPEEYLYAEINIYNPSGMLVRTLRQVYGAGSGRSREITWDGTDNNGTLLPSGLYIYRMVITADNGAKDMAYQKLIITR